MSAKIRSIPILALALVSMSLAMLSGCAESQRQDHFGSRRTSENAALLMPTTEFADLMSAEAPTDDDLMYQHGLFARNDDRLGSWSEPGVESMEWLEVRTRDYVRTINGRPREFSTTQTRSIKRGVVR